MDANNKIYLRLMADNYGREVWHSISDAHKPLFGTTIIPTAFLAACPGETVRREIQKLNPKSEVILA